MEMKKVVGSSELFITCSEKEEVINNDNFLSYLHIFFYNDCHIRINNGTWIFKRADESMDLNILVCSFKIKEIGTMITWWGTEY